MDFFVPGRTEIIGNHTDHQRGRVLAAAVRQGIYAQAEATGENWVLVCSEGFGELRVRLDQLAPRPEEEGSPTALLRGMLCALREAGFALGGFQARLRSELRAGGGLSSSAAFTVLTGRMVSGLFNGGGIEALTLARCGQQAENRHFGKPSGLMDQLACAMGQAVYLDFLTGEIAPVRGRFGDMGLTLCLTDTGGSHAGLTEAYAAIPRDMCGEAARFGQEVLCYVNPKDFFARPAREDLAYRRARHFFEENARVPLLRAALEAGDGGTCLRLMNESGRSSETLLENIRAPQGDGRLEEGLALSASLLRGKGAWRVHGGGFAGCVQALLPREDFPAYRAAMERVFGPGSCIEIM